MEAGKGVQAMSFGERLRRRREEKGMTQQQLAQQLGISKSAVGNYETGVSMPREDVLLQLFSALDAEPNYLFQDSFHSGGGALSSGEQQLVQRYRALSAKGKAAIGAVLEAAEEKHGGSVTVLPPPKSVRRIPLFASPAAAGYAAPVLGEEYEMIDDGGEEAAQFAVRIRGDSMEPHIPDGSIVYVGREPLQNGDVGIFCVDGDTFCKQYYKDALGIVYLFSLNRVRADADVTLPPSSGRTLACFGRVLLKQRFPLPAGAR